MSKYILFANGSERSDNQPDSILLHRIYQQAPTNSLFFKRGRKEKKKSRYSMASNEEYNDGSC